MLKCLIYVQKTFYGGISEFGRLIFSGIFLNPNSKWSAKFSSTLSLKISWKNIKKCKSLSFLSECVLRKNVNRDMATFVHFAYIELQIAEIV